MTAQETNVSRIGQGKDKWIAAKNQINEGRGEYHKVLVARDAVFDAMMLSLLAEGHLLIEGDAGTGKTAGAKTFARLFKDDVTFGRIQFTPDLLPVEITGGDVPKSRDEPGEYRFRRGRIFANVVLGDEINRAGPKTQAGTLEALEEDQVSTETGVHSLPDPFLFIATQNPLDSLGTNPLPRNQEDRFLMWLSVPRLTDPAKLMQVAERNINGGHPVEPRWSINDIQTLRRLRRRVDVSSVMYKLIADIILEVDAQETVETGPGERAVISMTRIAQAHALMRGESAVELEDIENYAPNVLMHRTRLTDKAADEAASAGKTEHQFTELLIKQIVKNVAADLAGQ